MVQHACLEGHVVRLYARRNGEKLVFYGATGSRLMYIPTSPRLVTLERGGSKFQWTFPVRSRGCRPSFWLVTLLALEELLATKKKVDGGIVRVLIAVSGQRPGRGRRDQRRWPSAGPHR